MTDEQVEAYARLIERWTAPGAKNPPPIGERRMLVTMLVEIRRLRDALRLSEASRGVPGRSSYSEIMGAARHTGMVSPGLLGTP